MRLKEKAPSKGAPKVARSPEVRHGARGVVLMLRRGLHGAVGWVLEPDDDGLPRTPASKAFRLLVTLLPAWVVLSALTGGPERGGRQASVPQAILAALALTVAGLAWFSARERRLGREAPWVDLSDPDAEGDDGGTRGSGDADPGAPTTLFEKPQVGDVRNFEKARNVEDITPNEGESSQIGNEALHGGLDQATTESSANPAPPASEALRNTAGEGVHQATSERVNRGESEATPPPHATPTRDGLTKVLHQATPEESSPQVSLVKSELRTPGGQATFPAVAESDANPEAPTLPQGLPDALRAPTEKRESSQLTPLPAGLQEPLRGVLREEYAPVGPYEVTEESIAKDWWRIRPDVPQEEPESAASPEAPDPAEIREDATFEVDAPPEPEVPETEIEEVAEGAFADLPDPVKEYLVSRSPRTLPEERKAAQEHVARWAREEVRAGRLTRAEVARMARVKPSTVTRWMDRLDDPWSK